MGNFTQIGVMICLFLLLGLNLSSFSGFYQINMIDSKNSRYSVDNLSIANQDSSEFLPDNSTWTDYLIDDDGNGYYDRLVINLGRPKPISHEYGVYGILNDSKGNLLGISQLYNWEIKAEILLSFQGKPINANGADGPYHVSVGTFLYLYDWWWGVEDFQMLFSYVTVGDYNASDFESPNAKIAGISDYGNDTNDDEVFDDIIFEFTIEVKDRGYYDLRLFLGPSAPFLESNQDFVEHWEGFLTPEDTEIILKFPVLNYHDRKVSDPLNVSYVRFMLYGIDIQFLTDSHSVNSYSYEPHLTYAEFTDNYWDWGEDTDSNSKFDNLIIMVEVNITLPGFYHLDMHLITTELDQEEWDRWSNNYDYWNEGIHNVTFSFDTGWLYSIFSDTTFIVEYVSIRDENYRIMDQASSPYTTRSYNYAEFDVPIAYPLGNFWDRGVDTNLNGKFDHLVIDVEINFTLAGTYIIEFYFQPLGTDKSDWNRWISLREYWSKGITNVSFSVDASTYYSLRNVTSFTLKYFRIMDYDYEEIYYTSSPYTTRIYNYTEFDFPDAKLTGNYWGRGVDRGGDGRFEVLVFDIEINVTAADFYRIEIQIKSVFGNKYFEVDHVGFWNNGVHWVSFEIAGDELFRTRVNSPFTLTRCQIRREDWSQIDHNYPEYSTRNYNYTEFNPPAAYLTGNYWDKGVDTDIDGKIDKIQIDVEVNVTQEGNFAIELQLKPYIPIHDLSFWEMSFSREYGIGIHNISVQLHVTLPYSLRLDTAYVIHYITIIETDNWEEIDSASYPYITHKYQNSEFDFPEVFLTGNVWDYGIDTDDDGKYDYLTVDIEINVTQPGTYYFEYYIHTRHWEYSEWEYIEEYYTKGIQNFSISIGTTLLYPLFIQSYLSIDNFKIYDLISHHLLDRSVFSYVTKTYSSSSFDTPPILLTYIFEDYGKNTDDIDDFDELNFYIGVNVTKTDTYRIDLGVEVVRWSDYESDYSGYDMSITKYLEEGIDFYIIVPIDAAYLISTDHFYDNFRVTLRSIDIYDSANNLCVSADYVYTSQEYKTNDFELQHDIVSKTHTLTTGVSIPNPGPSWNVPFGIVVLLVISIFLYLLRRPKG